MQLKQAAILVLCGIIIAGCSSIATLYCVAEAEPSLYTDNPFTAHYSGYPQYCNSTVTDSLGDTLG